MLGAVIRIGWPARLYPAAMDFLNVLTIKKIAVRKGCSAERTATIKYKHYVRVTGPDGEDLPATRGVGLGLLEAKRRLEAMPDVSARKVKGSSVTGRAAGRGGSVTKA